MKPVDAVISSLAWEEQAVAAAGTASKLQALKRKDAQGFAVAAPLVPKQEEQAFAIRAVGTAATNGNDTIDGGSGNDLLDGLDGDDLVRGFGGHDTLIGGNGNDTLIGGTGNDRLVGGDDFDTADYSGSGASVTVNLTTGSGSEGDAAGDTLINIEAVVGSSFGDNLFGSAVANRLDGGSGNDTIQGAAGADTLIGGLGGDLIIGGSEMDTVSYEASNDGVTISLNTGIAGVGGHAAGDAVWGVEHIIGSGFADHLTGDTGANSLSGRSGNDTILGGDGDDTIQGGAGADSLDGGNDIDTLSYADSDDGVTIDLANGLISGGHADGDRISGFEHIIGSGFADHLTGDTGANSLSGRSGNDTILGGDGDDTIQGGAGADSLDGGNDIDTLSYASSNAGVTINLATDQAGGGHADGDSIGQFENVTGSNYNDHLTGDDGNNTLIGGVGSDTLRGGAGNDSLSGGIGNDYLIGGSGNDTLDGGSGTDKADYIGSTQAVRVSLESGQGSGGDAEGDQLIEIDDLNGSNHDDQLTGNTGNNNINGGFGNDVIQGGDGADTLSGSHGVDTLSYALSDGAVTVDLTAGTGSRGHAEGDVIDTFENIIGSAFSDSLTGDDGNNNLSGNGADDTLRGKEGADTLNGGEDNDTFDGGMGNDSIIGGAGNDTLQIADQDRADYASIDHTVVDLAAGFAQIYSSTGLMETDTFGGIENVSGSETRDYIFGDEGDNKIFGHGGDDALYGGDGADTLGGGAGSDNLSGGDGADRFVIEGGYFDQFETITDFGFRGQDRLDLSFFFIDGIDGMEDLDIQVIGDNTYIHVDDEVTIVLLQFTRDLTSNDFIFS